MYKQIELKCIEMAGIVPSLEAMRLPKSGKIHSDEWLARSLVKAGTSHAKFSRGVVYYIKASFQAGFMIELDTYRHGREVLSTSSSIHNELKALSGPALAEQKQADLCNKVYTQIAMYSAQCLRKIYMERRNHRHPDWQRFCDFIKTLEWFDLFIMPEVHPCKPTNKP